MGTKRQSVRISWTAFPETCTKTRKNNTNMASSTTLLALGSVTTTTRLPRREGPSTVSRAQCSVTIPKTTNSTSRTKADNAAVLNYPSVLVACLSHDRQDGTLGLTDNLVRNSPGEVRNHSRRMDAASSHHDQVHFSRFGGAQNTFGQEIQSDHVFGLACQLRISWNQLPQPSDALPFC